MRVIVLMLTRAVSVVLIIMVMAMPAMIIMIVMFVSARRIVLNTTLTISAS